MLSTSTHIWGGSPGAGGWSPRPEAERARLAKACRQWAEKTPGAAIGPVRITWIALAPGDDLTRVVRRQWTPDLVLGGGSSAYLLGRLARAARKRPWVPGAVRPEGAFEERYRRLWFDTHVIGQPAEDFFIATVGRDRLVYGTNFVGWDAPDAESGHKPEPDLADNARRLLRARRSPGR